MLQPSQFDRDDAWIVFRLNDAPIATDRDGDFNVLCLMDAASCYILGNDFVPARGSVVPAAAAERLVAAAQVEAGCLPTKFFLSSELESGEFAAVVTKMGVDLVIADEKELSPFVSEAKQGFLAHIGGGRRQ